ncbi:hypothetical protein BKA69DRAFT_1128059 [Paraphysoderma sedebokerense]|nr:hypothetical protein BKA69DRAFT_1128059 [Paraphysoderma sedebokerense]
MSSSSNSQGSHPPNPATSSSTNPLSFIPSLTSLNSSQKESSHSNVQWDSVLNEVASTSQPLQQRAPSLGPFRPTTRTAQLQSEFNTFAGPNNVTFSSEEGQWQNEFDNAIVKEMQGYGHPPHYHHFEDHQQVHHFAQSTQDGSTVVDFLHAASYTDEIYSDSIYDKPHRTNLPPLRSTTPQSKQPQSIEVQKPAWITDLHSDMDGIDIINYLLANSYVDDIYSEDLQYAEEWEKVLDGLEKRVAMTSLQGAENKSTEDMNNDFDADSESKIVRKAIERVKMVMGHLKRRGHM